MRHVDPVPQVAVGMLPEDCPNSYVPVENERLPPEMTSEPDPVVLI
jgi:hypothetical protein